MSKADSIPFNLSAELRQDRRIFYFGLLVTTLISGLLVDAKLWRPADFYGVDYNPQIAESVSWWMGRLDLPERQWDTALKDGKVYSHFPPLFTFISFIIWPFFAGIPHPILVLILWLPIPILAYRLFYAILRRPWAAALLAVAFVCGTSMLPVAKHALRGASPYFVNHCLSVIGLLMFATEFFGRRRMWPACLGFVVMALSRQLTIAYAVPFAWLAWQAQDRSERLGRCLAVAATLYLVAGTYMTLNYLKFGHPLDSGYLYIYADRAPDDFSRDAYAHGIFSTAYVPRNLYYLNLGLPNRYDINGEVYLRPNMHGTGIWWTTPLLLWALADLRGMFRDPPRRALLAGAALVVVALLFYHSTGFVQRGFNRYSLDFLPALMAVTAPACVAGRRSWISVCAIVWSVVYFRWLI